MTEPLSPVAKANAYLDQFMDACAIETARRGRPITCSKGCFHCCKEMVTVERREAVYIVDQVPQENRAELTDRTAAWWAAFFAAGFETLPASNDIRGYGVLLRYRRAELFCPLLKAGACSVYAHRPGACRVYSAVGPAELCADDRKRPTQTFLEGEYRDQVMLGALNLMTADEALPRLQFDHLGIWLGHLLLGKTERSENAYEIETHA